MNSPLGFERHTLEPAIGNQWTQDLFQHYLLHLCLEDAVSCTVACKARNVPSFPICICDPKAGKRHSSFPEKPPSDLLSSRRMPKTGSKCLKSPAVRASLSLPLSTQPGRPRKGCGRSPVAHLQPAIHLQLWLLFYACTPSSSRLHADLRIEERRFRRSWLALHQGFEKALPALLPCTHGGCMFCMEQACSTHVGRAAFE